MFGFIADWFSDLFRSFFFMVDNIIYNFITVVYSVFLEISQTAIFTDEMLTRFAGKVYALVGIFMLFKVSFSILTYIINPDEFIDKNKGFGKLIRTIITSLILFISVPFIFNQAMDIQRIILKDNVIPKIFSNDVQLSLYDPKGFNIDEMSVTLFEAFYDPPGNHETIESIFSTNVNARTDGKYTTQYSYIISSVVGIFVLLILISFCFDIAIRSIKLGFLRLISPIPIISRVDPKKGNDMFNGWVKNCINTYLDLFIRLVGIYFATYIIGAVIRDSKFINVTTGESHDPSIFTRVFIICGVLLFAKQLPKLIKDLTGIELKGTFTLNPFKRVADVPIIGKMTSTTIGAVDSALHGNGLMAGAKRNWKNVSWSGDSKNSILETADRKMRREINEKRDNARMKYEGAREYKDINKNWKAGDKIYDKLKRMGVNPGDAFDGITTANYQAVFVSNEFINSKMKLDAQDQKVKDLTSAYEAYKLGSDVIVNGFKYEAGNSTHASKLYQELDKANKSKSGLEKVHETMRKQYKEDAEREDQYKFRKYNSVNPASK